MRKPKNEAVNPSNMLRLARLMKPYWKKMLFCMFCVLFVNLADLIKPLVAAVVIDDFLIGGKVQSGLHSIWGMGLLYLLMAAAGAVFSMTQVRQISRISQNILNEMRHNVFDKILHMSMKVLDQHGTGRLITRATNDVETVNEFYSDVFLNLFRDVFLLLGILVVMVVMDPMLALVAFTGVPFIVLLTVSLKKIIKNNFKKMKRITGQINGFFAENMSGMRIVQVYNRQRNKMKEFQELNQAYFKTTKTQVLLNSFLRPTMEVINSAVTALLIAYGYNRIAGGTLEIGILYAFTNYIKQFFEPINDLAEKYTTVQSALVSTERIYEILEEPGIEDPQEGTCTNRIRGKVEFRDVWFAYEEEDWVLKGISFVVEAGQKASFVGATGAGKSTIINLISRYYVPQKGQILIDDIPVGDWNLKELRKQVATVLQDVFLFSGNIGENIDMHSGLTEEEIQNALQIARADDFVHLEDTVSEQGLNYSTGQRQLLSFARAVAGKPAILVLDEATAHIDTNTEEMVQQSLKAISQGRTSIYIAHRLSTIRDCDAIFLLKDGVVAESGTHDELCAMKGLYWNLVGSQDDC